MAEKKMTREEILDMIDRYIYSNGLQRITAAQLHEVLTEIALSYAIEGGASSGIDAVLQTGSVVSEGRVITNEDGGTLNLAAEMEIEDQILKYIGMDFKSEKTQGLSYVGSDKVIIGTRIIEDTPPAPPAPSASDAASKDAASESDRGGLTHAFTLYNLTRSTRPKGDEGRVAADRIDIDSEGITSFASDNVNTSSQSISARGIKMTVDGNSYVLDNKSGDTGTKENTNALSSRGANFALTGKGADIYVSSNEEQYGQMYVSSNEFSTYIYSGPQASSRFVLGEKGSNININGPQSSSQFNLSESGMSLNSSGLGKNCDVSFTPTQFVASVGDGVDGSGLSMGSENVGLGLRSGDNSTGIAVDQENISLVITGSESGGSLYTQSKDGFYWDIQDKKVVRINEDGLMLNEGKRLILSSGGSAPTSGLATLSGGTVSVETNAVKADSVISLTVQETGTYTGNIRVSHKTPDSGFKITSTQDSDTCEVFWQIIDFIPV